MKKTSIILLLLMLTTVISAQREKLIGSWLMVKAEINGTVEEPFFIMDFKENGKTEAMEMELGTWSYNEKNNSIVMESTFDKDFNGEAKIVKLTDEELVVNKDGAKLFYTRINESEAIENNKNSNLFGVWRVKDTGDETILIKFEEPNNFVEITASEGMSSKAQGTWSFNPTEKSVIFVGFSHLLKGKHQINELTEESLILEKDGNSITAVKEKSDDSKIERLTFEYEDFPEEEVASEYNLPWLELYDMIDSLEDVKFIKYKKGSLVEELNTFKYGTIFSKIKVNSEKQSVTFTNFVVELNDTMQYSEDHKGRLAESYNQFFPKEEPWPYRIIGIEKVTVPAGTFECTVVEGFNGEDKIKYWLINNKPGIYAKYIIEGLEMFDDLKYQVYELEEIK